MDEITRKQDLILRYEEEFAHRLAAKVIMKPKLTLWIILLPIFIVFYIMQLQKCVDGRKGFSGHYLLGKSRALDEAVEMVRTGRKADIKKLVQLSDAPDIGGRERAEVFSILVEHFANLLQSDGADYDELVRSQYRNQTNYLLFLNRLNKAEQDFNAVLSPHLKKKHDGVYDIVRTMERESEKLRRETAEKIFF